MKNKEVEALKVLKPEKSQHGLKSIEAIKEMRTSETKNEIYEIKKWEDKTRKKNLKYETKKYIYHFQQYKRIRSFSDSIYTHKINKVEAEDHQSNSLNNIVEFSNKSRPRSKEGKDKKEILMKMPMLFLKVGK